MWCLLGVSAAYDQVQIHDSSSLFRESARKFPVMTSKSRKLPRNQFGFDVDEVERSPGWLYPEILRTLIGADKNTKQKQRCWDDEVVVVRRWTLLKLLRPGSLESSGTFGYFLSGHLTSRLPTNAASSTARKIPEIFKPQSGHLSLAPAHSRTNSPKMSNLIC